MDKLPWTEELSFRTKYEPLWFCEAVMGLYHLLISHFVTFLRVPKYASQGKMLVLRKTKLLNAFYKSSLSYDRKKKSSYFWHEHDYNNWRGMLNSDRKSHRSMQKNVFEVSFWWEFLPVWQNVLYMASIIYTQITDQNSSLKFSPLWDLGRKNSSMHKF